MPSHTQISMEHSAFYRLPQELLDQIIEYVGYPYSDFDAQDDSCSTIRQARSNLYSVALASKRFRASAQRVLFRALRLTNHGTPYHHSYARFYCLLRTLIDRPDLAARVKQLSLDVHCNIPASEEVACGKYISNEERKLPDGITIYGRPGEWHQMQDRCTSLIEASSFSPAQKAKWEYEISQAWTTPICGVILSLLANLKHLTLLGPGRGTIDENREPLAPLFGGSLHENGNLQRLQSFHWYERQLDILGEPDLSGLRNVAGLSKLTSLKLTTQSHITICGLKHLTNVKTLDVTLSHYDIERWRIPMLACTVEEREEFQNIESLRFDADMSPTPTNGNMSRYFATLTSFLIGLTSLRHLTIHTSPKPCTPGLIRSWASAFSLDTRLIGRNYRALLAALNPTYKFLESLELPSEFWVLPSQTPHQPVDFTVFESLEHLVTPRQALLGLRAVRLPDQCASWTAFYKHLAEGGQWVDERGTMWEGLETKFTNPETVERGPMDILPRSLRRLKILNADEMTCHWLEALFRCRQVQFPKLDRVELVLADECREDVQRLSDRIVSMAVRSGVDVAIL